MSALASTILLEQLIAIALQPIQAGVCTAHSTAHITQPGTVYIWDRRVHAIRALALIMHRPLHLPSIARLCIGVHLEA